jgi:2-oxoisovalerate dehydrogenase E1 component
VGSASDARIGSKDSPLPEIAAVLAKEAFFDLDAPIERLAMPDIPSPHSPVLLDAVLPSVERIAQSMLDLVAV